MTQISMQPATHGQDSRRTWLGLERVRVYSGVVLLLFVLMMATWAWFTKGFTDGNVSWPGVDFAVFWSASYVALSEGPVHAYDLARHQEVMAAYGPLAADSSAVLPWPYPPTFLLMVLPLALLPLAFSYLLFMAGGIYAYLRAIGGLLGAGPAAERSVWLPALASPALLSSITLGHNSLLTAALAGGAVALLAGRRWRTLLSAAATAALFATASVVVCGWETIPAFLQSTAWARENLMEGTPHGWYTMPSVLAAAALLATPYVRHYELTWMGIAVAGLVADGLRHGLSGREKVLFVAAWLLPVFEHANPLIGLPQFGPLVSMLLVLDAVRRLRHALPAAPAAVGT